MHKRAQGISINVIVIAALAILVLVVLSFIFLGQARRTSTETNSCANNGGVCVVRAAGESSEQSCGDRRVLDSYSCKDSGETCCLDIG
ncbi:hypothetical protein HY483_00015 [Candidatus Woesearchaeota archaeon]|nr:hypothetical protein [Candidatus Woesearchaeota archaeon]